MGRTNHRILMDGKQIIKRHIKNEEIEGKLDTTYVPLYAQGWRQPQSLTLRQFVQTIIDNIDDVVIELKNSEEVKEEKPIPPPPEGARLHSAGFAVDDNFLYVFMEGEWRRSPCSTF